jgi:hypothetical protein
MDQSDANENPARVALYDNIQDEAEGKLWHASGRE